MSDSGNTEIARTPVKHALMVDIPGAHGHPALYSLLIAAAYELRSSQVYWSIYQPYPDRHLQSSQSLEESSLGAMLSVVWVVLEGVGSLRCCWTGGDWWCRLAGFVDGAVPRKESMKAAAVMMVSAPAPC